MRESSRFLLMAGLLTACIGPARADFQSCLSELRPQVLGAGISAATFDGQTRGLQPNDAASFLDKQPEFTTPVWDYLAGLVDDERIADGKAKLREYSAALSRAMSL